MMEVCDKIIDGTFDISVEHDDGGSHLQVMIEKHSAFNMGDIPSDFEGYRTIVVTVPTGYLRK